MTAWLLTTLLALAPAPYPVSGYWLFGRPTAAEWEAAVARITALGADTVLQFGPRLVRRTPDELRAHAVFGRWALDPATVAGGVRRIYTYESHEAFGPALLTGPADQRLEDGERLVWRLQVPVPAGAGQVDLVYVAGRRQDSVTLLLQALGPRRGQAYLGMPCAPVDPQYPWDPDHTALPLLEDFTRRVLRDWAQRHAAQAAFAGVYQSLETPASERCLPRVLETYRRQHAVVREVLPGKAVVISPYWDVRRGRPTGTTVAAVQTGIALLATCDVDVIAPQDSRGTGKVGLHWPHEAAQPVDPRLHPAVGAVTYGAAYQANTRELYRAARAAVDAANAQRGRPLALWANLEAFEPARQDGPEIGRTTRERLDRAVVLAGLAPDKLISFMWDPWFTARAGAPQSLAEELEASAPRPLLVAARRTLQPAGLVVWGYQLDDTTVTLQAVPGAPATVALQDLPPGVDAPVAHPLPARLQTRWLPYAWDGGGRLELLARRGGESSAHPLVVDAASTD
ncbi:MAG: hypothetical protein IT204_10805 [Fimbriimonadaceae bacterium]|nr:hypothetical protein [Fimbriimonadaceae bacterium]